LNIIPVFLELEERKWRGKGETIVGAQRRLRRTGRGEDQDEPWIL